MTKNRKWTEDEIYVLLDMSSQGLSYRKMGRKLGRSYEAIRGKLAAIRRAVK